MEAATREKTRWKAASRPTGNNASRCAILGRTRQGNARKTLSFVDAPSNAFPRQVRPRMSAEGFPVGG